MIPNVHITITDFQGLYCVPGVRRAFRDAGVDFRAFLERGAMSHDLLGRGYDAMIERVVQGKLGGSDGRR